MTEEKVRHALNCLSGTGGAFGAAEHAALCEAVALVDFGAANDEERKDRFIEFLTWLLEDRLRVEDLSRARSGRVIGYLFASFGRFIYDLETGTPKGKVRKALATILRSDRRFAVHHDSVRPADEFDLCAPTQRPGSITTEAGQLEHAALGDACLWALHRNCAPMRRSELAQALVREYALDEVGGFAGSAPYSGEDELRTAGAVHELRHPHLDPENTMRWRAEGRRLAGRIVAEHPDECALLLAKSLEADVRSFIQAGIGKSTVYDRQKAAVAKLGCLIEKNHVSQTAGPDVVAAVFELLADRARTALSKGQA